jgi:pseudaminic acid synthase
MKIGPFDIGLDHRPFVIAEMSGNHNRSLDRALAIVDAAADAGAHAIKLQTYTADTMTLDIRKGDFVIDDPKSLWAGRSLYDLYDEAHTPWAWHAPLMRRAAERGMVCFSTPFDATSVDFLESLDVPAYKIASFENTDVALMRRVAATGKPMIVSTGMTTIADLDLIVSTVRAAGCRDLVLLQCTSTYPATPENSNLRTIPHMRQMFGCEIGLSDHTMGVGAAVAAVALGASVVEKHFTLSRAEGGVDSAFSLEPAELKILVEETERARLALGHVTYGPTSAEKGSMLFRRSLYVVADVAAGDVFSAENIRAIRPGYGLEPRHLDFVIGRRAACRIERGTPLSLEHVAGPAETTRSNSPGS